MSFPIPEGPVFDAACCFSQSTNSLVAIFTIIDHSEWTSKKTGKTYKDQRKLFVCKKGVLKRLRKMAGSREGLRGCTFDVSRIDSKSENVGDTFDFLKKWDDMDAFANKYELKPEDIEAYDYAKIVPDNDRDDLAKLGFGTGSASVVGAEAAPAEDYDSVL